MASANAFPSSAITIFFPSVYPIPSAPIAVETTATLFPIASSSLSRVPLPDNSGTIARAAFTATPIA